MGSLLKKLCFNFSWSWYKSLSAKSKNGDIQANSGDNVSQQKALRDINNYNFSSDKNAIEDEKSWEDLICCFTKQKAEWVIYQVNKPRFLNLRESIKLFEKGIFNKFKEINIYPGDPRAERFIVIKNDVSFSIENYLKFHDEVYFKTKWMSFRNQLISLKNDEKIVR